MKLLAAILLATLPPAATAGPWLRGDGGVFLSYGQNLALSDGSRLPVNLDPYLYAEWGATDRTTLSFSAFSGDAGRETTMEVRATHALPLTLADGDAMSFTYGVGARHINGLPGIEPLVQGGLAWGKGLETGWITAEALMTYRPRAERYEGKIDVTWGRHFDDHWSGYVLVSAGEGHTGDFYAKVSPTAILRLGDRTRVTLGATHALTGDRGTGLSFSSWLEF